MTRTPDILVVGAGIFGVTAALELRRRGHQVTLVDQAPPPHPLAASTDISKVVRMEYGADVFYMALVEEAMHGFDRWNEELERPFYHQTGVAMLARSPMEPGGFEHDSFQLLLERGHRPERLRAPEIARRFPAWNAESWADGFFHARGGWVESGALVRALFERALREGVRFETRDVRTLHVDNGTCLGAGDIHAGHTLLACGAWAGELLPELRTVIRSSGHPVFHLRLPDPSRFTPPVFCVFTADIARTGWYGFPVHPSEGVLKIGRHGTGLTLDARNDPRQVHAADETALRAFLSDTFPSIADAPIASTRRCLYADTFDADYLIDRHPGIHGLSVATGGSGHGFKMAPVLGGLIADAVEERANPRLDRFRWREPVSGHKVEAARFEG
jgi:glycine/D-amino acid oxidase-like deaminating enzyme